MDGTVLRCFVRLEGTADRGPNIAAPHDDARTEECIDGNQTSWFTSVDEGIERLLHRNGSHRSALSGGASRTRVRRGGHVRTGCPYSVAHTPARTDADRDGGLRARPALGSPHRGDPTR